jgi:hypothetical protein
MVCYCGVCASFVIDWLRRPCLEDEFFADLIHHDTLQSIIPHYSWQLLRLLGQIDSLIQYIIECKLKSVITEWRRDNVKWLWLCQDQQTSELQRLEWTTMNTLIYEHVSPTEIDILQCMLADSGAFRGAEAYEVAGLWIGMTLRELLKVLPMIHLEHTRGVSPEPDGKTTKTGLAHIRGHRIADEVFDEDFDLGAST